MQQLKEKLISGTGLIALGSGIACIGSYLLYKNIKESMMVDRIANDIVIDCEQFEKNQLIGRKQLIQILSESKRLVADEIKQKRESMLRKSSSFINQHNYLDYAILVNQYITYQIDKESQAIQLLQDHLGLNDDIINKNIVYYNQDLSISKIPFLDELKEQLLEKEYIYYYDKLESSKKLDIDYLSFTHLINESFSNILEKNEDIFDQVFKHLVEIECGINELSPCLYALAYDLFYINTNYTESEVKFLRNKFKGIFQGQKYEQVLKELNSSFQKIETAVSQFLRVKHKGTVQQLVKKHQQQ